MTWPVGWEALGRWGVDAARIEPLAGGVANDVWGVRVYGCLAVARLGSRGDADLDLALPHNAAGLDDGAYDVAAQASAAWEAAGRLLGRRVRGQAARRSPGGL